jgi:glycosyltransferase involved in cell wall biosynthesis
MRKRIAIFTHGGLGTGKYSQGLPIITQIVNRLAEHFDITVFSLSALNKDFKPQQYKAYSVPGWVRPSLFRWFSLMFMFIWKVNRSKFTILYSFWGYPTGFVTVLLGMVFRKKSFVNLLGAETANIPEIGYGHLRKPVAKKLVLWTCRNATKLISVSNAQKRTLREYGVGREIDFIPFGADRKLFSPLFKPVTAPLKILHVGNLTPVKDQETLLRAFALIRAEVPAVLKIVGPDFLDGRIQDLSRQLAPNSVEFAGLVPHNRMAEYYHWADVFILTSLSEGQNHSLMEAMMCGVLPVSTAVGIMDKEFGNRVGVVSDCRDYKEIARQLVRLYNSPERWNSKRTAACAWASEHDLDWTIVQLKRLFNDEG